jgi:hypothetical protein
MKKSSLVILVILVLFFVLCCHIEPGPISVENDISPSVLDSGDYINWEISVTNMGGEVKIERVHCREEIISGWAAGEDVEVDLPISNSMIDKKSTETIYSQTSRVLNTGPDDIRVKNTVTVYSDGGTESDDCIYTIRHSSSNTNNQAGLKNLLLP